VVVRFFGCRECWIGSQGVAKIQNLGDPQDFPGSGVKNMFSGFSPCKQARFDSPPIAESRFAFRPHVAELIGLSNRLN
jgi:hypothetical protein